MLKFVVATEDNNGSYFVTGDFAAAESSVSTASLPSVNLINHVPADVGIDWDI